MENTNDVLRLTEIECPDCKKSKMNEIIRMRGRINGRSDFHYLECANCKAQYEVKFD